MTAPAAIDGAALLNEVEAFHRRFNVFPTEAAYVAVALWDAHAHLLDCFDSTPRIAFLSPEPGSGKTRALEIVETLVPQPMTAVNASAAALFRSVSSGNGKPTILFDEIDTVFGPKAGDNEELRGFLNAGHRRTGVTYRCIGDGGNQTVQAFPSYCAVAVAGLGSLPDTIMSRSVIIRMRRRARNEKVEPFRARVHEAEGHRLRDRLAAWAEQARGFVMGAWPDMPDGVTDRPADVWEPLIAIADAAGGHWPERARKACVALVTASKANDKGSLGVRLLTDLRDHVMAGIDRLPTVAILDRLNALDDAPWADLHGKPLDNRRLSRMLAEYMTADNEPITSRNIKTAGSVLKGYYAADLWDAWARYCPPPPESPLPPLPGTENAA
ncbi:DNA primase [Streptomyces regensis]|nr:DNA primase [Streptomyces regensis]